MKPIDNADFGKTADDYVKHRAGFPRSLFERLLELGIGTGQQTMLDLGTGTGTLARGFALAGNNLTGIDPAPAMLAGAKSLDAEAHVQIEYIEASAEQTGLPSKHFDIVSAGQCWHWFDPIAACEEISRLLKPGGQLVVASYDWLPLTGNMVRKTEELIESHNPDWRAGNLWGVNPQIFRDLGDAGFRNIRSFSYDEPAIYSHEAWRGRIRASAGIAASLSNMEVLQFDAELADMLTLDYPNEPLEVPHRVFVITAQPAI